MYIPYIADGMLNQSDTTYFNVNGIMIYDGSIGWSSITEQVPAVAYTEAYANEYVHRSCRRLTEVLTRVSFPFNDTYIEHIHNISATCGYDAYLDLLTFPPKGPFPGQPGLNANGTLIGGCDVFYNIFKAIFEINPCFDVYQVGQLCPIPWDVLGFPYSTTYLPAGFDQVYFNRTDVKKVIHAPLDSDWVICSHHPVFVNDTDLSLPSGLTGGPLQSVIEKTNNVIVAHGTLDMVFILNGSLLTLQNLTWNGAQGFSQPPVQPFYVPYAYDAIAGSVAGAGIFGGWVTERGLTFCSVDLSGHEVPEYQPSAAYRHVELLLGRIANLSEVSGFTTQPNYPQSQQPLSLGNGPY
jgi:carboxypeptidase D